MGMFDTLNLKCPYCKHINQIQTKVGDCMLNNYNLTIISKNYPTSIGGEMNCNKMLVF